jgi:hypothetical protein
MTPCSLEGRYERFVGTYWLNLQGKTHSHSSLLKMGFEDYSANNINLFKPSGNFTYRQV